MQSSTVIPFVEDTVSQNAVVHTDEFQVYNQLAKKGYAHERVSHSDGVFVNGNAHTNSIEGFWAQVKNAVNGVRHGVSPEYLQHYVNEYAFRYNHRNDIIPMFQTLLDRISADFGD